MTNLKKHIPSQLTIASARVLISYEGQPSTCYGCNEQGHISHDCLRRRQTESQDDDTNKPTWVNIVTQFPMRKHLEIIRETVPSQQGQRELERIDTMNEIQLKQTVYPEHVSIVDEVTHMDTQAIENDEFKLQKDTGEALEAVEMTEILTGIDTLDNNNTRTSEDICTCDIRNEETGNTATAPDSVFPIEQRSDDDKQMEEIQLPSLQWTSLRSKKLEIE